MKPTAHWTPGMGITLLLTLGMWGMSRQSWGREFFFPELLALSMGCFWMASRPWRATRPQMAWSLAFGGAAGWLLTLVPGLETPVRMLIGYALCGFWLETVRCNFTPMFSACLLPLLLGEVSPWYPAIIAGEGTAVVLLEKFLEMRNLRPAVEVVRPEAVPWRDRLGRLGVRAGVLACLLPAAWGCGSFYAAPPLLVVFSVFADLRRPARFHPWLGVLVCALAAALGVGGRLAAVRVGFPEWAGLLFLIPAFAAVCRRIGYFLPPSAAVFLLAFLIPEADLGRYLYEIPLGALVFSGAGRLISMFEETRVAAGSTPSVGALIAPPSPEPPVEKTE